MNTHASQATNSKLQRLHGLDFCRAIFMILGLFYHAALIYSTDYIWRVTDTESSSYLTTLASFVHAFRMEAFYLISGFFYLLVFTKNYEGFLQERLTRVIPPLLLCGLLINPIMNLYSYERTYDWSSITYFINGQWLGHLWFLGNLIVYFVFGYPFCKKIIKIDSISRTNFIIIFCFLVPFISLVFLVLSKWLFSGSFIFVSFDLLFEYFPYFLFGALCFQFKDHFISLLTYKVAFVCFLIYFLGIKFVNMELFFNLGSNVSKAASKLIEGFLVLSMTALFYNIGKGGSKAVRLISDASYTTYLLHQPLIVIIYYLSFKGVRLNVYLEYTIIIVLTFLISIFWHFYSVKKHPILSYLFNGVKPR
ncbi:acyltransferase family protein [Pseudoalteromonas shioyasakiensis]|uniref:acyltransferase family protein n=1 Tax=Pseudoalteromonas shioyasakiensis TaxID=1190813 RepID=UPI0021175C75|nr:acyltransferase family protein [Pseudoalteromonas shioyasakiensis]MCQ8876512.1 acyltransferase family protein [Pseudoalteromonas shioyasakiensis]